ncbi:helix-turn-helix domain-containing protein [Cohnella sp. AR92]|uniref:helix-turn-helix domain-containing protein n=1 Tax=Cohnella sp. AR92 TaxID=648716 RepID=UPI000F8C39C6|nr:helix-turn-helix domain-containing protein [Cohnella sp. AR92]RUS45919.1 helix-turn-helix domain-containing protein [Cohnella sp. AR92]
MYRAVVVDDEKYDLEGLRRLIPWAKLGIEVVCSENKPLAALSYMEEYPIDILVTDIKMPVLTGLELSRKAMEKNPDLRTIFISGYQDFEYAKQALHLKADGYVLKPIDDDEIEALLKKVVSDLDDSIKRKQDQTRLDESFAYIKGDFLQHLLEGSLAKEAIPPLMERFKLGHSAGVSRAGIVELDDVMWRSKPESDDRENPLQAAMAFVIRTMEGGAFGPWCSLSATQVAFIHTGDAWELENSLNELNDRVRAATPFTLTSSYGEPMPFPYEISRSFAQAKELIGNKMFIGKNRVISPAHAKLQVARDATDLNAILDEIFAAMAQYDLLKICDCMEELFDNVRSFDHPEKVHSFSIHVASKLEAYLRTAGETFHSLLGWGFEHLDAVRQFETAEDIKSWLRRALFEISERLFFKKQGKNRRLMEPIEQYVQEHLEEELTLRELANRFSYSANHMGLLFKDHMGESFNDYLVRHRMERAKALLLDSRLKVYEIADRVGYKSLAYFSRLFRDQFGITPGDYRKQG